MEQVHEITIVHLEDNPLDAELTFEILLSANISCKIERIFKKDDFQEFLIRHARSPRCNLILADYNMPGFDGLSALRMTREVDSDLPFILLSGALGEELAVELLRNGATDYVLKNNLQRLAPVVSRAIEEHQIRMREKQSQEEVRRARDEANKANTAKSRFLGRISHELRTPLNAIIGYTQLMQSDPMSEEQEHCASQILKAGEHLLQLINEVLDITKIESGVIPMTIKPTSIAPVIERAVDLIRPLARDSQVSVSIDGGPCELYALVDKDRLAQVLINLITNAVKYNRPGGDVFVECHEERVGFIKMMVRDTGIGIPPSKMERLFTPFDRLDLEKDTIIPGTGLGLAVAKTLVENMGGTMGVVSSEGEGCIFWLEVPSSAETNDPEDFEKTVQSNSISSNKVKNLLLVEDNVAAADFMERAIRRRSGYRLTVARSIEECRTLLPTLNPDVFLIDLNLPDGCGEELINALQKDPGYRNIPIIVVTADHCPDRKQKIGDLGITSYFIKPLNIHQLLEHITSMINQEAYKDGL